MSVETAVATAVAETRVPAVAKLAAAQFVLLGLGFGGGAVVALAMFVRDGILPMTPWGFRAFAGPLSDLGRTETLVFGAAIAAVELTGTAAGVGLWRGRRWAGRVGLAITPLSFVLAVGFALPLLLIGIPLRVITLARAWRHLR